MPEDNQQPTPKPRDFRQEVTDNIVALLEKGVAPWQKPWDAQSHLAMPVNPTSDRAYRGGNAVHLLAVGLQRNYQDPRWMTYKQASEQGWQVRRGEKGTQIEFWDVQAQPRGVKEDNQTPDRPNETQSRNNSAFTDRLVHRVYTVFNAQQVDGVPPPAPKEHSSFEVVDAGERILKNSGAKIAHDQADRAFYSKTRDEIHLPPKEAFKDAGGYYGTALHELAHWTGHPVRLDRKTLSESYRFGDTAYAKEELRAELASVFIAAEKGIPHNPQDHAAYVGSWIEALKKDKNEIFRAAHEASKAADLLLSLERDKSLAEQDLETDAPQPSSISKDAVDIQRDREALDEQSAARETTKTIARHDSQNGVVAVKHKENGAEERIPVPKREWNKSQSDSGSTVASDREKTQSQEASRLAAKVLGLSVTTKSPQIEAGVYRGSIIGETSELLLQRVSAQSVIAHDKQLFDPAPRSGSNIAITYSNGVPSVREIKQRARAVEVSR
jgi:antirestriction protein ArdC